MSRLGRLVSQPAATKYRHVKPHLYGPTRGLLSATDKELDLLLTGIDLASKHPGYFWYVSKEEYDKNFSKDVIRIHDTEPEDQIQGDDNSFYVRRYATVLPLVVGIQMIPVPFILDTGAPAYMYLCTTAIRHLDTLGIIKKVSGRYPYRLMVDLLGPNDKKIVRPPVDAIPLQYELHEAGDSRVNLLGVKAIEVFWGHKL